MAAWVALGVGFALLFHGHEWLAGAAIVAWLVLLNQNRGTMTQEEMARERQASAQRRAAAREAVTKRPTVPMGEFSMPSSKMKRALLEDAYVPPPSVVPDGCER